VFVVFFVGGGGMQELLYHSSYSRLHTGIYFLGISAHTSAFNKHFQ